MADREKLIELLIQADDMCLGTSCPKCEYYRQPECRYKLFADHLIDNSETVRERGRWIQDTPFACVCSVCNHERYGLANDSGDNFCPNCGADMRGEEDA